MTLRELYLANNDWNRWSILTLMDNLFNVLCTDTYESIPNDYKYRTVQTFKGTEVVLIDEL